MYVVGVLAIATGIAVSIALHEVGHLIPAKRFGVKCPQYMIGFGPTLWSRRIGQTQYGLKAFPLGGYVRMIGMFPPKPGGPANVVRASSTGRWSAMVDDARAQSQEEIGPGDEDKVFYKLSTPKKLAVMLGGPLMNLLIASVILTGIITLYGQQVAVDGARVGAVVECVKPVSAANSATCAPGDAPSPAAKAGVLPDDVIVEIAGSPVKNAGDVSRLVRPNAGRAIPVVVERGGERRTLSVTPIENSVPVLAEDGTPQRAADGAYVMTTAGYMGTSTGQNSTLQRQPLSAAPAVIGNGVAQTAGVMLRLPEKVVGIWQAAFGSAERDQNSPMSVVGVGRVAGDVSSTMSFGGVKLAGPSELVVILLMLLASLNIALFVFNLIPLMPLDGGHVVGALWEGAKRTVARLRGAPDPGYVDVAKGMPLAYAMSAVLIGLGVLLIYADLVKPIRL